MRIRRVISIFMLVALVFSAVPVSAQPDENLSERILVTDFKFVSGTDKIYSVPAGSDISAEFYIERTKVGTGEQEFCAFLMMYDGGSLKKLTSAGGTVTLNGGRVKCTLPKVTTGADISKTSVRVVIVNNKSSLVPLSPSAELSGSNAGIKNITVGGQKIDLKADVYNYSLSLTVNEEELPVKTEVIPYDMASEITVTEADGVITVRSTSSDKQNTVTYTINTDITVIKKTSLKSISADGIAFSDFKADKNIYYVDIPYGGNIKNITCETYFEGATATVTQSYNLPGKAVIKVSYPSRDDEVYEVRFTKALKLTPLHIGMKQHWGDKNMTVWDVENETMPSVFTGNSGNYNFEAVQLNSNYSTYTRSTRTGYFDFDANLPDGAVITDASLTISYLGSSFINLDSMTPEVFNATDTKWIDEPSSYGANTIPEYGSERITYEDFDSATEQGRVVTSTKKINTGKLNYNLDFAIRLKEYVDSVKDYMYLKIGAEYMPLLELSYYYEEIPTDYGDISDVPVTNKYID